MRQLQLELISDKLGGAMNTANAIEKEPWICHQKAFRMIDNVYFVGNNWVSCFLIDTGNGLVLIDCAMQETFYQLVDSIYSLGFSPYKIKHLFLSHGHFDHVGAAAELQKMTDCYTWLGEDDAFFFTERRDLIFHEDHVKEFRIDRYYDYSTPLKIGNVIFELVHAPGHTPGTTCFFFDVDHEGQKVRVGMHGGLGLSGLSKAELEAVGRPLSVQQDYLAMLEGLKDKPVDVVLPSHSNHPDPSYRIFEIASKDDGTGNGFIQPDAWKKMLEGKIAQMQALIESGR